jgi:ribosome maturation factor RimP
LTALLAPVVRDLGLELWELEYAARSNGGLLRLYIDSDAGITVEDCAQVSHAVSEVLDANDPIPGFYTLEVSSPGLDRVLRTREHFERVVGELARVEMSAQIEGRKRFGGRLQHVSDEAITLHVDGIDLTLPLAGIHKARLAPELESQPPKRRSRSN